MTDLLGDLRSFQGKDPQQALDDAVATVKAYCQWHIVPVQTDTLVVRSPGGLSLYLPTRNLTAVVSVTQDGVVVPSTSYDFEKYGAIKRNSGWFVTWRPVTVVFTHGYADWPDDVKGVILSLAQRSISDNRGLVNKSAGNTGQFVQAFGPSLTKRDEIRLASYVVPPGMA